MNKIFQRLLIFFIGTPIILGIALLNYYNHLPLNFLITLCSAIAAFELYNIFSHSSPLLPKKIIIILTLMMPLLSYILILLKKDINLSIYFLFAAVCILMGYESITSKVFKNSNVKIALSVLIVFYCGFLFTFLTRMTEFKNSIFFICIFLFSVFICDSFGWLFGVLLGKNNRGYIHCSPNKSIAGFAGGFAASIGICTAAHCLFPQIFYGNIYKGIILGFFTALSGITGDLTESVFKRSASCKDSGNIILGRGGLLDSIDSVLFAAPVYYICVFIMYNSSVR